MNNSFSIRVEGLWKQYGISSRPGARELVRAVSSPFWPFNGAQDGESGMWALRNVSFEVKRGETVGIIGRNGAGKSTLLRVLAGVTPPTRGRVEVHGRVFPMIELNAGVHPELTGRENTYLLGAIMGVSRKRIEDVMPQVEDFVELGEWFDRPVRTYSSGMVARLGFGVATRIESDILLIDETFAVGDLRFQNKSLARIKEMRESGATVIVVTHSLDMLQFIAQRGIVFEEGAVVAEGSALEGLRAYEQLMFGKELQRLQRDGPCGRLTKEMTLLSARIFGAEGQTLTEIRSQDPFGIEIDLTVHRAMTQPVFSVGIINATGVVCVWNVSEEDGFQVQGITGTLRLRVWYSENRLSKGAYEVNFTLREQTSYETLERLSCIASFTVTGSGRARGIMALPAQWEVERERIDE